MTYADINFDAVKTIDELSDIFATGPYAGNTRLALSESKGGILTQYREASRNNYENAAMVLYTDRTKQDRKNAITVKKMWFDEDGNRTARPIGAS